VSGVILRGCAVDKIKKGCSYFEQPFSFYFLFSNFITSSSLGERMISVRLFIALPSGVSLLTLGKYSPLPDAVTLVGKMP
jgi:hypothetical protein